MTEESIHDLFAKVRAHPDFVGGTIFTLDDVAERGELPSDWKEKWLTDRLVECGNETLDLILGVAGSDDDAEEDDEEEDDDDDDDAPDFLDELMDSLTKNEE